MRYFVLLCFVIGLTVHFDANAQTVYKVRYASDADVKVYVCNYKSDADLCVYYVKYKSDATRDGLWYPVRYKSDADLKIYFVRYKSDADLKIYEVKYKSDAGWQNKQKSQMFHFIHQD